MTPKTNSQKFQQQLGTKTGVSNILKVAGLERRNKIDHRHITAIEKLKARVSTCYATTWNSKTNIDPDPTLALLSAKLPLFQSQK